MTSGPIVTWYIPFIGVSLTSDISKSDDSLDNDFWNSFFRASLAIAKALSFANKIDLYGFNSNQIINKNYVEIIDLFNKGALIKNLIKPQY